MIGIAFRAKDRRAFLGLPLSVFQSPRDRMNMHSIAKVIFGASIALGLTAAAGAQPAKDPKVGVTVNDPEGPAPNPANVAIVLPKDMKCIGTEGKMRICNLYGDPKMPGPYSQLFTWWPGNFTKPHYHNDERWGYVISGTWWVSSSTVYDERTTTPVHAGSVKIDKAHGIHWDGARSGAKEPTMLVLSGTGPSITQYVDENGKDTGPVH